MGRPIKIAVAFQSWQRFTEAPVIGAARFAQERGGIELVDVPFREDLDVPKEINRIRPDGVITQIAEGIASQIGEDFFNMLPLVNVGWDLYSRGVPSVCTDVRVLVRVLVAHLAEAGYGELGMMLDTPSAGAEQFIRDFCAETGQAEAAIHIYRSVWPGDDVAHDPGPNESLQEWLLSLPKPIGIITAHGYHAMWITQECERLNLKIPGDVGIISRLDENVCLFARPAITSVQFGGQKVGYEAMRMLHGLLHDPGKTPDLVMVAPEGIVQRGSTGTVRFEGEEISRALRFIQQHATDGIQVDDVLEHTQTMSRSKFYSLFVHRVGRSPAEEIRRVKMERAKQLLLTTKLSITQISNLCGFNSIKQFSETFRKEVGTPARRYRNEHRESSAV